MSAERVPLLLYHSVASESDPRFARWTVAPEAFAAQMSFLAEHGYRSLTVRDFVEAAFERRRALPPRSVVITFDDGFADFASAAWPELDRNSLTATVFVATGYVGRSSEWLSSIGEGDRPILSWAQIERLDAAGVEFGAHGHEHAQLDLLPAARVTSDVARSKRALEEVVGPVTSFAYPHGYYTKRVQRQLAAAGFASACGAKHAFSGPGDDRYALARLIVERSTGIDAFERMLRGDGLAVAPRGRTLRRGAWRTLRRAGGERVVQRLEEARARAHGQERR